MGTTIIIQNALLYPESTRTLIGFKDIRSNNSHLKTIEVDSKEYLLLTKSNEYEEQTLEKIPSFIRIILYIHKSRTYVAYKIIFQNLDKFKTWHDRLGHPGIGMMRKIVCNSNGHDLNEAKFPQSSDFMCTACATGKLILRPSYLKIQAEPL